MIYRDVGKKMVDGFNKGMRDNVSSVGKKFAKASVQIKDAPTEDVAPVVHAHWFESYWGATGAECSNCHCVIPTYDMDYQEVKHDFEYCPFCGAKMEAD